jgi:hypothetical protein
MRWRKHYTRIVERFALFPIKSICDAFYDFEYRWFETVYLKQYRDWLFGVIPIWRTERFATKFEYDVHLVNRKKETEDEST